MKLNARTVGQIVLILMVAVSAILGFYSILDYGVDLVLTACHVENPDNPVLNGVAWLVLLLVSGGFVKWAISSGDGPQDMLITSKLKKPDSARH